MKKSVSAAVLAIGLLAAAVPVSAANETSKTTELKYSTESTWTVTIPATLTLSDSEEVSAEIKAATNLAPKTQLQVKVSDGIDADGKASLVRKDDTSTVIKSLVTTQSGGTAGITGNTVVASFEGLNETEIPGGTLYFSKFEGTVKAGEYTGSMTFSIAAVTK